MPQNQLTIERSLMDSHSEISQEQIDEFTDEDFEAMVDLGEVVRAADEERKDFLDNLFG